MPIEEIKTISEQHRKSIMTYTKQNGEVRRYDGPLKSKPFLAWVKKQDPNKTFDWEDSCTCAVVSFCQSKGKKVEVWTDHYYYYETPNQPPVKIHMEQVLARVFRKFRNQSEKYALETYSISYLQLGEEIERSQKHTLLKKGGTRYVETV